MNAEIDVRSVLPSIRVPTLVIHRTGDRCLLVEEGKYLADKIPEATFIELPGNDHLPFLGDADAILEEIERFLKGMSGGAGADCVLATVLCVQFDSELSEQASQLLAKVKREIAIYRGQNFFADNGSMLITFDGPVRSVLCAFSICRIASSLDLAVCCGLETGTCNVDKSVIYGPAVEGAKLIASNAPESKVWLTSNLRNLISGSALAFKERDENKGWFEAADLSNRS